MVKRYGPAVLVVLVLVGASRLLPASSLPGGEIDLERDSERIGWTSAVESDEIARDIFDRVNDERSARGIAPLRWHDGLADRAQHWSETMIAATYEHSTAEFRAHPDFAGTGENIFMGPLDATEAHVGWMHSDGHRDNLLSPDFSAVGIGVVCRNDGRMWATQIFGMPHGAVPRQERTDPKPIVRDDPGPACPDHSNWTLR